MYYSNVELMNWVNQCLTHKLFTESYLYMSCLLCFISVFSKCMKGEPNNEMNAWRSLSDRYMQYFYWKGVRINLEAEKRNPMMAVIFILNNIEHSGKGEQAPSIPIPLSPSYFKLKYNF